MRKTALLGPAVALALAGCNDKKTAGGPAAAPRAHGERHRPLLRHERARAPGPKGQIILASRNEPVWFSSARDAFSFTLLPEEPKDIRAIYVSDMAKAPSWEEPGANELGRCQAGLVRHRQPDEGRHGRRRGRALLRQGAAEKFAAENGGRVVAFAEVPKDYVLGAAAERRAPSRKRLTRRRAHRPCRSLPAEGARPLRTAPWRPSLTRRRFHRHHRGRGGPRPRAVRPRGGPRRTW